MKSVVLVALSGFWFCNSLVRSFRKSVEFSDELDGEVDLNSLTAVEVDVAETVMANSGSLRRTMHDGTRSQGGVREGRSRDQTDGEPKSGGDSDMRTCLMTRQNL